MRFTGWAWLACRAGDKQWTGVDMERCLYAEAQLLKPSKAAKAGGKQGAAGAGVKRKASTATEAQAKPQKRKS